MKSELTKVQPATSLAHGSAVTWSRSFHVEMLRGGMNRLLLRAMPSANQTTRIEILFQYVQHVDIPMQFRELSIRDATRELKQQPKFLTLMQRFPECRIFCLESEGAEAGHIVAAACMFGEDSAAAGADPMFPMMS